MLAPNPSNEQPGPGWSLAFTDGGELVAAAGGLYIAFIPTARDCRELAAMFTRHADRLDRGEVAAAPSIGEQCVVPLSSVNMSPEWEPKWSRRLRRRLRHG